MKTKIKCGKIEGRKPGLRYSSPVKPAIANSGQIDGSTHGKMPIKQQRIGK